ncbi:glycine zipper family protein [Flavisericum labens]|uniref:glycine zipper family protein n=1 Tax=Flavisericum labens TaxID=3377112 RepID=UPI00387AEE79
MENFKSISVSLFLVVILLLSNYSHSQVDSEKLFVRVYNIKGKKINKGRIVSLNDSILRLKRPTGSFNINVKEIGYIKTKRSGGHNIGMGVLIGATVGAISGATLVEPDPPGTSISFTRGDNAAIGAILGMPAGALIGGATILSKKSKTIIINGDPSKWDDFMKAMNSNRLN